MSNGSEGVDILEQFLETNKDGTAIDIDKGFRIYYLKSLTDNLNILNGIKQMYFLQNFDFDSYFSTISKKALTEEVLDLLYTGNILAAYKGDIYSIPEASSIEGRSVSTPMRESSLEGGLVGFIEKIDTNMNLVRHLYSHHSLETEIILTGKKKNIKVAILYDSESIDKVLLDTVRKRIQNINLSSANADIVLSQHILGGQWSIPKLLTTERPDRVVMNLLKGRAVIFLEGTPSALVAPSTFHDFMSAVDDHYLLPVPAFFLVSLRYLALFISVVFPASYVAFTAYNPEVYRAQLALSIAGSRSNVPYPAFIEVLFMLFMMELLIEASVRLPKTIGQTAATVGGLILGQAMTQASLVSSIMVIIVAAVAISNFVMPVTSMGLTMRVAKYFLLILAVLLGTYGMVLGVFALVYYIFSMNSFSQPFLNPIGVNFGKIFSKLKKGNF